VNKYVHDGEGDKIPTLKIEMATEEAQKRKVVEVRAKRDAAVVQARLEDIRRACRDPEGNVMRPIVDAVKAYATLGEICDIFRDEFGVHTDPAYL
jgi:methylmalonyl-CoA mutase, N-terminal domain